jgi:hypothetical protein
MEVLNKIVPNQVDGMQEERYSEVVAKLGVHRFHG